MRRFQVLAMSFVLVLTAQSYGQQAPDQVDGIRYEAEEAELSENVFIKNGMVEAMNRRGASCVFTVDGGKGGIWNLKIGYSTALPEALIEMDVNGESEILTLPGTGAWDATETHERTVELKLGTENHIAFKSRGNGVNLDYIEIKSVK